MTDLRSKVESDRGLLKQLELHIPGFKGYRKREDLRAADSLLRQQLAGKMKEVNRTLGNCREALSRAMELTLISDMGDILKSSRQMENRIRHAQQGYTGVSADYRIEEAELNKLYEWDLALIQTIESLAKMGEALETAITESDGTARQKIRDIKNALQEFDATFNSRIAVIAGLEVE